MKASAVSIYTPVLKYLDLSAKGLAGRGGAIRIFWLAAGVDFAEETIPFASWPGVKKELVSTGANPAGHVPVVSVGGDTHLTESYAILRRYARTLALYGGDVGHDYATDVIAESVTPFRNEFVNAAFGDTTAKQAYLAGQRTHHLRVLSALVAQYGGGANGHAVASQQLTYADALLFAVLWDDAQIFGWDALAAPEYSVLHDFVSTFRKAHPRVAAWCEAQEAAATSTASAAT